MVAQHQMRLEPSAVAVPKKKKVLEIILPIKINSVIITIEILNDFEDYLTIFTDLKSSKFVLHTSDKCSSF